MELKIGDKVFYEFSRRYSSDKPKEFRITEVSKITPKRYYLMNGDIVKKNIIDSAIYKYKYYEGYSDSPSYRPLKKEDQDNMDLEAKKMKAWDYIETRSSLRGCTPFTIEDKIKIYELFNK